MSNNKLKIKYLKGTSLGKISNKKSMSLDNISVAGSLDFTKFFEPNYNLSINSINNRNIYIEAIPIDLEGNLIL